ncbi:siderophore-interacting protein [Vannielia litorea]|uniref:siderophore-interacting protein n=1 Tax=Vannielia litorea TaxID=1217970 RepID=UPI001C987246|nr:SIP domain-containing protein [Vannielia litorea]MBY6046723.1 SIP domain-containing protein [Vannielia litorea]MBY6074137.1 SIP domain-containing protein [Vannielia litorea]
MTQLSHLSAIEFRHNEGARLLEFWRAEYLEHGMEPQLPAPGMLVADAGFARVTVQVTGRACRIEVACADASMLPDFRTGISAHMEEFDRGLPPLTWSGVGEAGALPPTLAVGEVAGCAPLGDSWWRMHIKLSPEGYARFASDEHWHFRLLRPVQAGRAPVWPRLDATGVIRWPEGDDKLSDRVFTTRLCHPESHSLTFDIFRHPGGPTCDWAETGPIGQTVGLMGPGGRTGPEPDEAGGELIVGGDETSAPAILRALQDLPPETRGKVNLLVGSKADIHLLDHHSPSCQITWLCRADGATEQDLVSHVRDGLAGCASDTRLWFAASKQAARDLRTYAIEDARLPKAQVHSVGYWA